MMMRQRIYVDGKLSKSSKPTEDVKVRRWIDNMEKDWMKNGLFPLTAPGQFDMNACHTCERVSIDELIVVNTAGKTIRIVNVAAK